jgi:hypothetical protein
VADEMFEECRYTWVVYRVHRQKDTWQYEPLQVVNGSVFFFVTSVKITFYQVIARDDMELVVAWIDQFSPIYIGQCYRWASLKAWRVKIPKHYCMLTYGNPRMLYDEDSLKEFLSEIESNERFLDDNGDRGCGGYLALQHGNPHLRYNKEMLEWAKQEIDECLLLMKDAVNDAVASNVA